MNVDRCRHTFVTLAAKVMPALMREMRKAMRTPHSMTELAAPGAGVKRYLGRLGLMRDFAGCYVLLERKRPIYVGISQHVVTRLIQHVKGRTHFDASLAYQMACKHCPHKVTRARAMTRPLFRRAFAKERRRLSRMQVAWVHITNPVELHLFEVYCAMELNTGRWNTFQTH